MVSIISTGTKSVHCCQQFGFLSFSFAVWSSTGLDAGSGTVCPVHYSTSDVIASHSVNHQLFADDTQLQKPTPPNNVQSLTRDLQLRTDDIKSWTCSNQLKLNEDKIEAILFSTLNLPSDCLPSSVTVGTHQIAFSDKVHP